MANKISNDNNSYWVNPLDSSLSEPDQLQLLTNQVFLQAVSDEQNQTSLASTPANNSINNEEPRVDDLLEAQNSTGSALIQTTTSAMTETAQTGGFNAAHTSCPGLTPVQQAQELLERGRSYFSNRQHDLAISVFNQLLTFQNVTDKFKLEAYRHMAIIYYKTNNFYYAKKVCDYALSLLPAQNEMKFVYFNLVKSWSLRKLNDENFHKLNKDAVNTLNIMIERENDPNVKVDLLIFMIKNYQDINDNVTAAYYFQMAMNLEGVDKAKTAFLQNLLAASPPSITSTQSDQNATVIDSQQPSVTAVPLARMTPEQSNSNADDVIFVGNRAFYPIQYQPIFSSAPQNSSDTLTVMPEGFSNIPAQLMTTIPQRETRPAMSRPAMSRPVQHKAKAPPKAFRWHETTSDSFPLKKKSRKKDG